ncbi:DUF6090 family protein [Flagellimonas beolgyonensis]|uniref:DUF6090 family protein n=1 Tax=Flagellimonas beolgyonensis TaxID=864064 RepID=UPI000F8EB3C5|nr:DUF6090 family protein [Allomuricauda beolgyonensis]
MLKFFRKIRRDLLSEGKTGKYLKYAVGEIVLVVIGILIALQINNWNENRKDARMEIQVLQEISENLGEDILSLENDVYLNKISIDNVRLIEEVLRNRSSLPDSLLRKFGAVTFSATYTLKWSGYKNLSNIGFHILTKDTIRESITNLYETHYSFIKEREAAAKKTTFEYVIPRYLDYFDDLKTIGNDVGTSPVKLYTPKNFEALKEDPDFLRLLHYSEQIKQDNLYDLGLTLNQIRRTKRMIDIYLENKD